MAAAAGLGGLSAGYVASFVVITFLFGLLFKLLPDVAVSWKSVGIGAVVTAVLLMLGKF